MKYVFTLVILLFTSCFMFSQVDEKIETDEMKESLEAAMEEMQKAMKDIDLNSLFSQDFSQLLGDSLSGQSFDLDSILGMFNLQGQDLLGGDGIDMQQGFKMLEDIDMNQLNKLFEGIDMTQLEGMMEGIDMNMFQGMMDSLDMNAFEKMFEGMDMEGFERMAPGDKKDKEKKDSKKKKRI